MGLMAAVVGAAKAAFSAVGDLATTVTYRSISLSGQYDPARGQPYDDSEIKVSVKAVLSDEKSESDPTHPLKHQRPSGGASRKRALILQSDLEVTPKISDELLLPTGEEYIVEQVTADTAFATWSLVCGRKAKVSA